MNIRKILQSFVVSIICLTVIIALTIPAHAQLEEPKVQSAGNARYPLDEGLDNRIGGSIFVNNFGFGIGGIYSHALGPFTEFTFTTGITGIRDASEQSFQDFFTGQRIVPNKLNRALGIPILFGIKKRLFPEYVADNFRFFIAGSAGPALSFVYPYIDDEDGNGYRSSVLVEGPQGNFRRFTEQKNDFFSGLGDGFTEWGATGEIKVGVDLGSNFKQQSTLEIGYFFYYFDQGLQILESRRPVLNNEGEIVREEDFFEAQKFFGTPQIKFTYSGWW